MKRLILFLIVFSIASLGTFASAVTPEQPVTIRLLSDSEIMSADISSSAEGSKVLEEATNDNLNKTPLTVYKFGEDISIVNTTTKIRVALVSYADSRLEYEVQPIVDGSSALVTAGFVSPPVGAFVHHSDGFFTTIKDDWIRKTWWNLVKANNYTCSNCGTYDYWRIYGKVQGSTDAGSNSWRGYKRLWIEFDRTSTNPVYEFEPSMPKESIAGASNSSQTIGFGASLNFPLGAPPVGASGTFDYSYSGTIYKSTENWHPVVRSESGSGGVQWCYYTAPGSEFTGTRYLVTRVSVRQAPIASAPKWAILTGMSDSTVDCPTQL